ncbi:MAG: S-layer homology domain-containing protein, partial [Clostridiales bacterium]|nr:S-layer homology domain-containing protein [Clostridiales bacterium]
KLTTTIAPYSDVAATRWSAGSIAYCTNEGIIAGDGNGRFNPAASVTGLQFGKMLLVALGYDAEIEKLVGNSWAINTAKLALNTDLDEDMEDISLSKELTREEAAQMAFNAMKANIVEYDTQTNIDIGGGSSIVIGNKKAYNVTTSRDWGKNIYDDEAKDGGNGYIVQFAEQYCRDLELNETAATADSFGRPAHKWSYDNDKVGTYADKAVLSYTTEFKGTELADDIDDAGCEFAKENGKYNDVTVVRNGGVGITMGDTELQTLLKDSKAIDGTGNGVAIEFYANDKDEVTTIVVVATYLGEVKSIKKDKDSTKADERELKVEWKDNTTGKAVSLTLTDDDTKGFNDVYDNVKVGDKVLVTPVGDNTAAKTAVNVAIPETVEAAITKVNNKDKELTAGGEVYGIAKTSNVTNYTADTDDVTLYLDQYGYVMDATSQSDDGDKSVAVLKAYQTLNKDGELVPMIKGVTSDGETVNWETDKLYNDAENKVRIYTEEDNVYTLSGVNSSVADNNTVSAANVSITKTAKSMTLSGEKVYFASDVKFIFVNEGKATVLDGVQKVNNKTVYVALSQDESTDPVYATAVYVMGTASNTTATSDDLVYVQAQTSGTAYTGVVSVIVDGEKEEFYTYDAYINGEEVENFYTDKKTVTSGFYTVEIDNDSNAYVLTGNEYNTTEGKLAVVTDDAVAKVVDDVLTVNNKDYDISNATIVDISDNSDDIGSSTEMKDVTNLKVKMIINEDDMTASYIYVVSYTPAP